MLALGTIAHNAYLEWLKMRGETFAKRDYPFAHGALHDPPGGLPLLDSYHVSFQNTNTGKLTAAMFDALLARAKGLAGL